MKTIKRIGLLLIVILLIPLLGCEVVCPECPPPEVTCLPAEVTVNPEIVVEPSIECPEPEITVELSPEIDVELPEPEIYLDVEVTPNVECPDVMAYPYSDPRYGNETLEIAMRNHLLEIDYYPTILKEVKTDYQGNGVWILQCKFQSGGIFYRNFVFSEWTDDFVE